MNEVTPFDKPKSRALAGLLGALAPGLGLAFLGHGVRGLVWALTPLVVFCGYVAVAHGPSALALLGALGGLIAVGYLGAIVDAVAMPTRKHRPKSMVVVVVLVALPILAGPIVAFGLRAFVVEAFKVPSGSMIPTIAPGDHLFVDKSAYRGRLPRRGELFVFRYPEHPEQDFVKRAIAIGGDRIEVKEGHPVINGFAVPFCVIGKYRYLEGFDGSGHEGELSVEFLESSAYLVLLESNGFTLPYEGPWTVKPGETWAMGDNRNNAHDSRRWFGGEGGGVPANLAIGPARLVWFSNTNHQGVDLAGDPVAPSPELAAPLAACLGRRPTLDHTTPPAGRP